MNDTLTKLDLAKQLVNEGRFPWMTQKAATDIIETIADLIACHFQEGGSQVTLRGFGSFKIRKRRAFVGSNPRTGKALEIPERKSITFKPSVEVTRRLNN